ncbi:MAG: ABC transporter permease subunit [Tissierellia bacterium]|nr:ABC transporter permease subunit [Tissierellia bacterium]
MNLFGLEFKANFGKMIAWAIVLAILIGLLLAFYPLMLEENTKSIFDSFSNGLSPSAKAAFGLEEEVDYTNMPQYIAFIYQYLFVLIMMFAMQLGASSLSKEQQTGNIEYIYSNPITRSEIINEKLFANILVYLIFLVILAGVTFGISIVFQPVDIRKQEILIALGKIFLGLLCSGLVFLAIGYFFSAMMKSSSGADGLSVLFVFLLVVLVIVAKVTGYGMIAGYTVFEAFKPIHMLKGNLNFIGMGISLGIFILGLLLCYVIYGSKELKY